MAGGEVRRGVRERRRVPCVEQAGLGFAVAFATGLGWAIRAGDQRPPRASGSTVERQAPRAAPDRPSDAAPVGAEAPPAPAGAAEARPDIPGQAETP